MLVPPIDADAVMIYWFKIILIAGPNFSGCRWHILRRHFTTAQQNTSLADKARRHDARHAHQFSYSHNFIFVMIASMNFILSFTYFIYYLQRYNADDFCSKWCLYSLRISRYGRITRVDDASILSACLATIPHSDILRDFGDDGWRIYAMH